MPRIKTKEGKIVDVSPETAGHMVHHGYAEMVDDDKPARTKADDDDTSKRSARKK
jgi:hypothetical protein